MTTQSARATETAAGGGFSGVGADPDKIVDRVGKLLAQAEGTDNEHEAAAFIERAQQIATAYAVDLELARTRQRDRRAVGGEPLEQARLQMGSRGQRGNRHRVLLYVAAAHANDVVVNVATDSTWVLGFGHRSDLAVVEQLWASLALQMAAAAQRRLDAGEHRSENVAGTTWRLYYYDGYVQQISVRLQAARERAVAQVTARLEAERAAKRAADQASDHASDHASAASGAADPAVSAEVVLLGKAKRVRDFHDQHSTARGSWRGPASGRTRTSWSAQEAGERDGARADLGDPGLPQRGQITG